MVPGNGVKLGEKIREGKTKIIYSHPEDPSLVIMYFKDDITAGDGAKHDVISGKGLLHWEANKNIFELLNSKGIATHYKSSPAPRYSVVKKLDEKYELEVVARRIATGSYLKRHPEVEEGTVFDPLVIEFFYKDDTLNDPMVDERHLRLLLEKNLIYRQAGQLCEDTFLALEQKFRAQRHQKIDLKIETGRVGDTILVTDTITPDEFRLWPYKECVEVTNLPPNGTNVIDLLNKGGMKDKQVYREGGDLSQVKTGFEIITEMTKHFNK